MEKSKHIGNVIRKKFSLEVYQCRNGFHLGLDTSYLDQMSDMDVDRLCEDIIEEKYDMKR